MSHFAVSDNMKLFVVLFAFLAVQASARVISEEADVLLDDILESFQSSDFDLFDDLSQNIFDELTGDEVAANPEKCLPYIPEAYKTAVEVRRIIKQAGELGNVQEEAQKCRTLPKPEKRKCYRDLILRVANEVKSLIQAYLVVRPKVIDIMGKFDKCMGNQTVDDVVSPNDALKCLPYVPEAYSTAVEVRRLVHKPRELGKKFVDGAKKCFSQPDKRTCFQELKKQLTAEGQELKDSLVKVIPKAADVLEKFDKCMGDELFKY